MEYNWVKRKLAQQLFTLRTRCRKLKDCAIVWFYWKTVKRRHTAHWISKSQFGGASMEFNILSKLTAAKEGVELYLCKMHNLGTVFAWKRLEHWRNRRLVDGFRFPVDWRTVWHYVLVCKVRLLKRQKSEKQVLLKQADDFSEVGGQNYWRQLKPKPPVERIET